MHHYDVHYRVRVYRLQYCTVTRTQLSEELRNESLRLGVIEQRRVVLLVEDKLECRIVYQLLNLLDQFLGFGTVQFETQLQVLIVENTQMRLWVVLEDFDDSGGVDQVLLEEFGEMLGRLEDFLVACELFKGFHLS